jgi:tRNA (mo5U34)-methyltransferase
MKPTPVISIDSDITGLARAARHFEQYLERVKAGLGDTGFLWYPYDSFASIEVLPKFLKDQRRRLLKLAQGSDLLDVGAADGVLSFFFEHLGFGVDAVDHAATNYNGMRGIRALQRALNSKVRVIDADLDSGAPLPEKRYGLAFCLGLLYHVRNPFSLLERLAERAQYCILSTRIAQLSPDHKTVLRELPVAFLVDADELNSDATNHWIFSEAGLFRILKRTGWEVCDYRSFGRTTGSDPVHEDADERAFCLIRSTRTRPDYRIALTHGWHAIEEERWRWTEARFGFDILTETPVAFTKLRMRLHLPPAHFARTGPVTLSARAEGAEMPACVFAAPGDHVYEAPLPAYPPRTSLHLEFTLDRCVEPTGEDARELGIVVPLDAGRQIEAAIER